MIPRFLLSVEAKLKDIPNKNREAHVFCALFELRNDGLTKTNWHFRPGATGQIAISGQGQNIVITMTLKGIDCLEKMRNS